MARLHSLDRHRLPNGGSVLVTTEAETLANYTSEMRAIATQLKQKAKRVIFVDTTPVPLQTDSGPERHNADVIAFNAAANNVMDGLQILTSDVYSAVMDVCPSTSGAPDHTYSSCELQSPNGVHFPGHYDVLVAAIYKSVTGKPAPPPPPPMTCAEAAAVAGCVGLKGKGAGDACNHCYMNTKKAHPGEFDGPACLANYTNHIPKLQRPQESFVQCWCYGKSWGNYTCAGEHAELGSKGLSKTLRTHGKTDGDAPVAAAATSYVTVDTAAAPHPSVSTRRLVRLVTLSFTYTGRLKHALLVCSTAWPLTPTPSCTASTSPPPPFSPLRQPSSRRCSASAAARSAPTPSASARTTPSPTTPPASPGATGPASAGSPRRSTPR
jgi:hypothetical protein